MWILTLGARTAMERPDGVVAVLRELGCHVEPVDLFEPLDRPAWHTSPPTAILVEAIDEVDAARAALFRVRRVAALAQVPTLIAVSVPSLSRLSADDAFDDFVLAPYVPAELYARVRRAEWRRSEFSLADRIKIGDLCIDLGAHEATVLGTPMTLTHQEFALLRFLAEHRGRVFTREQLLDRVWGVDYYGGSRTVDIHVRRLRAKMGTAARLIFTVRGVGYKMTAP